MATKSQRKKADPLSQKRWLKIGEAAMLMSAHGYSRKAYQVRELVQQGKIEGRIGENDRYEVRTLSLIAYLRSVGVLDAATAD